MSLRIKLLAASVVLALIPLVIAGWSMIRITQDLLKSSVNTELLNLVDEISMTIEDSYRYQWLAPLRLIKKAVESKDLGFKEKRSLLTEGMKTMNDFVALQIYVEGVKEPLLVIQGNYVKQLKSAGLEPGSVLELTPKQIYSFYNYGDIFVGNMVHIKKLDSWILTISMVMDENTFGRPAFFSARINMDSLRKRVANNLFTESGSITLIDSNGLEIFVKNPQDLTHRKIVKTAKNSFHTKPQSAETYTRLSGKKMLGAFAFPESLDIGVIVEKNEADAYMAVTNMKKNLLAWILGGFLIAVIFAAVVSVTLTRPLQRLTKAARMISDGDLSVQIEDKERKDEIGELSQAFNKMVYDLDRYIQQLTETTKEKERAESELQLAKNIQQTFLPKTFPSPPEIDVWGLCESAREVGGDYFDFFKIDDDRFGMVIGDVAGKGVPASLFMAVSRTLFRILSAQGNPPDQVLTEFNDRLVELDQGTNMFITMFYGVYYIKTGSFVYATAGHNMPFVHYAESSSSGKFMILPGLKTMVAGLMDGMEMESAKISLTNGDIVVLYTDGMIEAVNAEDEEFGEERFEQMLEKYSELDAEQICQNLIHEVKKYQIGMPQFDDMTMFVMKVQPHV